MTEPRAIARRNHHPHKTISMLVLLLVIHQVTAAYYMLWTFYHLLPITCSHKDVPTFQILAILCLLHAMAPHILLHCETRHDVGLGQPQPQADSMLLLTTWLKHEYKSILCGMQKASKFAPQICPPGLISKFAPKFAIQIGPPNLPS